MCFYLVWKHVDDHSSINKEEELANVFHEIRLVLTSLRFFHQCKCFLHH